MEKNISEVLIIGDDIKNIEEISKLLIENGLRIHSNGEMYEYLKSIKVPVVKANNPTKLNIDLLIFNSDLKLNTDDIESFKNSIKTDDVSILRFFSTKVDTTLVVTKDNLDSLYEIVENGLTTSQEEREFFASEAFNLTSVYDNQISNYLFNGESKDKESTSNLQLTISKDDYDLNDFLICWKEFGERPNRVLIHNTYSTKLFNSVMDEFILERNIIYY